MRKNNTTPDAQPTRKPTAAQLAKMEQQRQEWRDKWIGIARAVTLGAIIATLAAIGFTGSWQNLRDLGELAGQSSQEWWHDANITPLSVDLMLIVASIQHRRKRLTFIARLIARVCSIGGLLISLAGNVLVAWLELPASADGLQIGYTLFWHAVPVLSLLGAIEMLTHTHKDRPTLTAGRKKAEKAEKAEAPEPVLKPALA